MNAWQWFDQKIVDKIPEWDMSERTATLLNVIAISIILGMLFWITVVG
jgi:hypothetical protein